MFNNKLAILLIIIIPVLWCADGKGLIQLDAQVSGALIATWTTVIYFYFRKKKPEAKP